MAGNIDDIAQKVLRHARSAGYVRPCDIRAELERVGEAGPRWREVVHAAGPCLALRNGRYYYVSRLRERMRQECRELKDVKRSVRMLIRSYKASVVECERRDFRRLHFILPIKVITADGREINAVSQDISLTGVRLIACCDFTGQRVRIIMPRRDGCEHWSYSVQILWSTVVGDNLIENGGLFLGVVELPAHGK